MFCHIDVSIDRIVVKQSSAVVCNGIMFSFGKDKACLASLSAASFPVMPTCAGIQTTVIRFFALLVIVMHQLLVRGLGPGLSS